MVLNYKKLPYKTEWLEYPDIAPRLKALGVSPGPSGSWPEYSCPTIKLPNGELVMDSRKIAERLESLHPQPSLYLDTKVYEEVLEAALKVTGPIRPMILPLIPYTVLREPSASWFIEDRERRFGKTLEQLKQDEGAEEVAWPKVVKGLEALKQEMSRHKLDDGPFVTGSEVSYSDFLIAGLFTWLQKADAGLYEKMMGCGQELQMHHEACKPWLARDDH